MEYSDVMKEFLLLGMRLTSITVFSAGAYSAPVSPPMNYNSAALG
jgi:hypothetical protein